MEHRKLISLLVMITIFGSVGGIAWALLNSQAHSEFSTQEQVRDTVMTYIKTNHPETEQFMENLLWTGGRVVSGLLGAETYVYTSQGWNVTIHYPVVANPVYSITADYRATSAQGEVSIPYRIVWEGTFENGQIAETSYTFAQ